jgi:hypothetical protein
MTVWCNDRTCEYYEDGFCCNDKIEIDGMCLSYRSKVEDDKDDDVQSGTIDYSANNEKGVN